MVKNPDLKRIGKDIFRNLLTPGVETMVESIELPEVFEPLRETMKYEIAEQLADFAQVQVDEDYRIRMMMGNGLVYVYDFEKPNEEEIPTKDLYRTAIRNTEMMYEKFPGHFEEIIKRGIINNRFGYYVTVV